MKRFRVSALLLGLTAALTLAACGVPPSDVIQAGEPASGIFSPSPDPPAPADVYFLVDGAPTAYLRKVGFPGGLTAVLTQLFDGPAKNEAAVATTELPRLTTAPEVTFGSDNTVSIRLPKNLPLFSHAAMLQVACTVADATAPPDSPTKGNGDSSDPSGQGLSKPAIKSVQVLGNGWTRTQQTDACPDPLRP